MGTIESSEQLRAKLEQLATLVRRQNAIQLEMAELVGRPATAGNLGEYIAAAVFDIDLAPSGVNPGHDGFFRAGPLQGRSVNIKLYSEDGGLLDISRHPADYYLVLAGPKPTPGTGVRSLPRRIDFVYLFDMEALRLDLNARGVGVGVATSVRKALWQQAQIYPTSAEAPLAMSRDQINLLQLFGG